ncbi:IS3 family transposase [Limnoglobus roseus]|uniref:IS3 family transposase n=1 Tax=Limnoglobus roseus TaxID=2598579 RepID=A0A5C1A4S5_9BACT|nr:IS3 family transposase [Limnoglobus roseus]QEL14109.1 IS3 family transposase [Limnoglobus roseus]
MIFAWIEERRGEYPVAVSCRVLGVSRSGYYARANRPRSKAAVRREELVAHIRAVHADARERYGSPRLARELKARGVACCVNTVAKVMKAHGIRAKAGKRFVRTTDSGHRLPVSENVLGRDFTAARPNEKWAIDLTYVPTLEGWLFLALVVDLFSRRIAGWAMAATMTSRRVVDALDLAVGPRGVPPGSIAHSDRGSQYASEHYQSELCRHGLVDSMSGVGQCWDNAVVESMFGRLKQELVHGASYATRDEAKVAIFEYIEVFYTRARRHSSLGYVAPAKYERARNPNNR